jgi:CheY-like chemotaxis protein
VLLLPDTAQIISTAEGVFSGISWNTVWSGMPPNLLGILCDPGHPAFGSFPTEFHTDWQWWDLVRHSKPMELDSLPAAFLPLVQMVPDWNTNKKIGLLWEAQVGKGRLLVSAIDLRDSLASRPVAAQLLYSLKKYAASEAFRPAGRLTEAMIDPLFKERANAADTGYLREVRAELRRQWPKNRTINLVFHGHSVPAGYGRTPEVHKYDAYPSLVGQELQRLYPDAVINIIVTAIGGENSEQGAARFEKDVLPYRPDVLFIDYALNDRAIGLERSRRSMEKMIRAAQDRHIPVILLTPSADERVNLLQPGNELELFANQLRGLAAQYGTGLADSYARFRAVVEQGGDLHGYMAQSNHPNRKGHLLIAGEILRYFR